MEKTTHEEHERQSPIRVLLIDDEDRFRESLSKQLSVRGYEVMDTDNGEDAIKVVRHDDPHVVILDMNMPGMDGIQTLRELKKIRPEVQVIMYTGHGSTESARVTGKHGVFCFLEKPCDLDVIIEKINAGYEERKNAMNIQEIPQVSRSSLWTWLAGAPNYRPGVMLLGTLLFLLISFMPTPDILQTFLSTPKTGESGEIISGYSDYRKLETGQTIADYYIHKAKLTKTVTREDGTVKKVPLGVDDAVFKAKVMVGILVVAALFWATGAVPIGVSALLVGVLMYFFGILQPGDVAAAYAKDSVVFIFGVLAFAAALAKTGLDRRIGILLLGTSTTLKRFVLIFAPLLAVTASFLSEHALVAFIAPILLLAYWSTIRAAGVQKDRYLVVMFMLLLTFSANLGGPGSPAAGGRNAVMLGILSDYGIEMSFGQWVKMGLPFVPVAAMLTGIFFYFIFKNKIAVKNVNIAASVKRESEKIGKMTADEYKSAGVLIGLIFLWATMSDTFGMGGPVILALVVLNVMGILRWKDINGIHWDVVALYAAASALGVGLASTGAALWLANACVSILPEALKAGTGLCMSTSLITGIMTNFMSDGATVAAIGPITVPMATLSGTSPLMVGLSTAFASSFAHLLIIGTPNNAICYALAKDPETGEQLVTMKDFFIYGGMVWVISMAVLWGWVFFGYWNWITI